jgi:NAD dependent epimerase/dehydratase family enzyme
VRALPRALLADGFTFADTDLETALRSMFRTSVLRPS